MTLEIYAQDDLRSEHDLQDMRELRVDVVAIKLSPLVCVTEEEADYG